MIFSLFLILATLSTSLDGAEKLKINLQTIQELIEQGNLEIQVSKYEKEAADNRRGYLRRSFMPKVTLEGGLETFSSGPYSELTQPQGAAKAEINAFNGFRDYYQSEVIAEQAKEKDLYHLESKRNQLLEMRKIYWEYLFKVESIKIHQEGLRLNAKNIKSARQRVGGGIATSTDLIEFEQNQISLEQTIETLTIEIAYHELELKNGLGLNPNTILDFGDTLSHVHNKNLQFEGFSPSQHISGQMFESRKLQMEAEKKVAREWWVPKVDVYAAAEKFTQKDRDYFNSSARNDYTVGFKVSMDLFDGGESFNQAMTKSLEEKALSYSHKSVMQKTKLEFDYALKKLELVDKQLHGAEKSSESSDRYYKNTLSEYSRGVKNSPDVLGASQGFIEAKEKVIELRKDYEIALANLNHLLGK